MNIYLIGPRGVGKSAIGSRLAVVLHRPFCDMDAELARRIGQSIHLFVQTCGWPAFRRAERTLLEELSARTGWVVSTGGGVVLDEANIEQMRRSGRVVRLLADAETLLRRLEGDPLQRDQRPSLQPGEALADEIRRTLSAREALYRRAMHLSIRTDHRSVEALCIEISLRLGTTA